MDSRLGALPDDIEALKAALIAERSERIAEAARAGYAEAELAVARAKASRSYSGVPSPDPSGPASPTKRSAPGNIVQALVERTIAWLNRCRRLAKDWENLNRKALAFLRLTSIRLMLRKLCNPR